MKLNNKTIRTLAEVNAAKNNKDEELLSVYQPNKGLFKKDFKKRLKSTVLQTLHQHSRFGKVSDYTGLIKRINQEVDNLNDLAKGVALFAALKPGRLDNQKTSAVKTSKISLFSLPASPFKKGYASQIYELRPLIKAKSRYQRSLVISLKQESAEIFIVASDQFKLVKELENSQFNRLKNEELNKYSPTREDKTFYGSGEEKRKRRIEQLNVAFLNQVEDYLEESLENKDQLDLIFVFYSKALSELVEDFVDAVCEMFPDTQCVLVDKNVQRRRYLKKRVLKKAQAIQKELIKEELEQIRADYKNLVKGWKKVLKAARETKIRTLFVKPRAKKTGYVVAKEGLPYLKKIESSEKTPDVSPWLVNWCLQNSADVFVSEKIEKDVVARLRY